MAEYSQVASQMDISEEEKDKLVAEVVRSILFKSHQSSGCPIKREEITQLITRHYRQRSLPQFIIDQARIKLSSIFGYEMKEIQRIRLSSAKQRQPSQPSAGEAKSYLVASKLPEDVYREYVENQEQAHISGIIFAVVGLVHLAGGRISSDDLWHHLRRLGLEETDENHLVFGSVRHAIESLVQQRYLHKEKGEGPEGKTLMYQLAERAMDQSFQEKLKDLIAEMGSDEAADDIND